MTLSLEQQVDRALFLAGRLTIEILDVPEAAWEMAAARPELLPHYRAILQAALAFRRAVNQALHSNYPSRATAPGPIPHPLPQPETSP